MAARVDQTTHLSDQPVWSEINHLCSQPQTGLRQLRSISPSLWSSCMICDQPLGITASDWPRATKINQPISVINLCDLRSATWVHSLRPMCSMTGWVLPPMICLANLNLWKQSIQTQSREHAIDWPPVLSQGSWTLSSFSSICHYDQIIQFRAFSMLARQSVRNFLLPNPVRFRDCEVRSWERAFLITVPRKRSDTVL